MFLSSFNSLRERKITKENENVGGLLRGFFGVEVRRRHRRGIDGGTKTANASGTFRAVARAGTARALDKQNPSTPDPVRSSPWGTRVGRRLGRWLGRCNTPPGFLPTQENPAGKIQAKSPETPGSTSAKMRIKTERCDETFETGSFLLLPKQSQKNTRHLFRKKKRFNFSRWATTPPRTR